MQYKKLFEKSEIEYITPFLKLRMAFNSRYKEDLKNTTIPILDKDGNIKKNEDWTNQERNVRTDADAIYYYKTWGWIKTEFVRLLNSRSPSDESFQNALAFFVKLIQEWVNENLKYSDNLFYRNPASKTIQSNSLLYISPSQKEYYYSSADEDRLYEETLDLIYKIRCCLVHGDFDIDDKSFIWLIEYSYWIVYPVMDNILQKNWE